MAVVRTTRQEHPLPAVVMHWAHAVSMLTLVFTGFDLYYPLFTAPLGLMRLVHMVAAFVLMITTIVRIYWGVFGRGSAGGGSTRLVPDWTHFAPERANRGQGLEVLKYYFFMRNSHPRSAKYHTLQKGVYLMWLLLIIASAVTGFALWGPTGSTLLPGTYVFGGPIFIRSAHYLIMWLFIVTLMLHIYFSFAEDSAELSLMFLWKTTGGSGKAAAHHESDASA